MSTTNHTTNYELSQYIGSDVTSYLSNYNSDMYKIDAQMKVNADDAAVAKSDAASAVATSTTAATNASAAVSSANAANTTAETAQTAATAAQTAAGAAQTDAAAALRASASNTIENLAPPYDPTLIYGVGDLVTYVDPVTNQGKLYKCIISVTTPMAFNVNYWDDITASEAFRENTNTVITVTANGTDTLSTILSALWSGYTNPNKRRSIFKINMIGTVLEYASNAVTDTEVDYTRSQAGSNGVNIESFILKSTPEAWLVRTTTAGTSVTDELSNVPTSGYIYSIELI